MGKTIKKQGFPNNLFKILCDWLRLIAEHSFACFLSKQPVLIMAANNTRYRCIEMMALERKYGRQITFNTILELLKVWCLKVGLNSRNNGEKILLLKVLEGGCL